MFDFFDRLTFDDAFAGLLIFIVSWIALDLVSLWLYMRKLNGGDKK